VTDALLGLVAFVVGWFAVGSALNVRRGNAALKWMQGGLKQVGDKATVKKMIADFAAGFASTN